MSRMPEIGGGSSQLPIAKKDVAETFGESDVTLTQTRTEVVSGSVQLGTKTGSTVSRSADDASTSKSNPGGLVINPNTELNGVTAALSASVGGVSMAYLKTGDGSSTLASKDISSLSSGDRFELRATLQSGTNYRLVVDDGGNGHTTAYDLDSSTPVTSTDVDIVDGIYDGVTSGYLSNVNDVTALVPPTSGKVHIEWPEANDVFRWDAATFQATEDGETVSIDVQESTDGGSTWTTIATAISRGQDISNADPSGRVRLVATLERTNTANNPRVDSVARRWVL